MFIEINIFSIWIDGSILYLSYAFINYIIFQIKIFLMK